MDTVNRSAELEAPPPPPGSDLSLSALVGTLWRRRLIILALGVAAFVGAWGVLQTLTPRYTAQGTLVIETQRLTIPELQGVVAENQVDSALIRSESQILSSRGLLEQVVKRLDLGQYPEFNPTLVEAPPALTDRFAPGLWLPDSVLEWLKEYGLDFTIQPALPMTESQIHEAVLWNLTKGVVIGNDGRSYVFYVSFTGEDPEIAAKIVNALMERYIAEKSEARTRTNVEANTVLSQRIETVRGEVEELDRKVQEFRKRYQLFETRSGTIASQQLSEINTQLATARADRAQAESRYAAAASASRTGAGAEDLPEVLSSAVIIQLRAREAEARQRQAETATRLGPNHPQRRQVEAELAELRRNVGVEVAKVVASLRSQLDVARSREAALERKLSELRGQSAQLAEAENELRQAEKEAEARRTIYEGLLQRAEQTSSSSQGILQVNTRVVSVSVPPGSPSSPRRMMVLVLATGAGLMLGAMLALLREQFDDGFDNTDDILNRTGVIGIAAVPRLPGRGHKASPAREVARDVNSPAAETMRGLRARIRFSSTNAPPKIVLVTSAIASEGKSSVAAAFARVAAIDGLRTLLIEADLHQPSLARMLALPARAALVDGLSGRVDWGDCITVDPETGLHLLLADESFEKPQQVFESMQFQNLLSAATAAYDMVVIDSPPVMVVSDAILLSHFADSVLLVAESGRTRRRIVVEAVQRLAAASRGLTGIVLSKTETVQVAGGFYGGYGKA